MKISFIVLILFGLLGSVVLSIAVHELSHEYDFRELDEGGEMCLLTKDFFSPNFSNQVAGYYRYNGERNEEYYKIAKYTEFRGYFTGIIPMAIFFICLYFVLIERER